MQVSSLLDLQLRYKEMYTICVPWFRKATAEGGLLTYTLPIVMGFYSSYESIAHVLRDVILANDQRLLTAATTAALISNAVPQGGYL